MQWILQFGMLVLRLSFLGAIMEMMIGDESMAFGLRSICVLAIVFEIYAQVIRALGRG